MADTLPFDFATQQEQLKRRQSYIDKMAAGIMEQGQPRFVQNGYGTFYAGPGAGDAIGKVLSAYFLGKNQEGLDKESTELQSRYNSELKTALEAHHNTRDGRPATMYQSTAGEPDPANAPMVEGIPAQPGDPRKAAIDAVASSFAPLREIGLTDLRNAAKSQLDPKDLLTAPGFSPESRAAAAAGGGLGVLKAEPKLGTIGDVLYDERDRSIVTLKGPQPGLHKLDGDLYQQSPSTGGLKKLDNAPKISVNNSVVQAGPKAGREAYFKHAADQVDALGKQANSSQSLLSTLDTLENLHKAGINSNITSDMATTLQNLGQGLGVKVDTNRLGNTETYNALITDLWQRAVSQYGGNRGVTKEEAEQIKKLTPLASTSPQAREMLFTIYRNSAARTINAYKEANASFAKAASADDPNLFQVPGFMQDTYLPPAANPPATGGKPSVSNW